MSNSNPTADQRFANQQAKKLGGFTGKGFMPGKSGNPSGKRSVKSLEEAARAHTPEAIEALVLALRSPRERVPAAIALLDRGWGKPAQMISGDANRPLIVDFRWADNTDVATVIDSTATQLQDALTIAFEENKE